MTARIRGFASKRYRVSRVQQGRPAEAGLACLAMIANFYGLTARLSDLRKASPDTLRDEVEPLANAADRLGLLTRSVEIDPATLGVSDLPAILESKDGQFVVLERVLRRRLLIHDPGGTSHWIDKEEAAEILTWKVLIVTPSIHFKPLPTKPRMRIRQLWSGLIGFKRSLIQAVVLSALVQMVAIAMPYYMQVGVDVAVEQLNLNLLTSLAAGFAVLVAFSAGLSTLRDLTLLNSGTSFAFGLSSNVARHLFRLPIQWFSRRDSGDILSRFQLVHSIRQMMTEDTPVVIINAVMALLILAVMIRYSPGLSAITFLTLVLYLLLRVFFASRTRNAFAETVEASGRETSVMIESLRGVRTLRLFGKEADRHAIWQENAVSYFANSQRYSLMLRVQDNLNRLLRGLENVLIIFILLRSVIQGSFSIGMAIAYIAYKDQFLTAGMLLADKITTLKLLGLYLEKISDIALTDEDDSFSDQNSRSPLFNNSIELRDIYFRYEDDSPWVLQSIDLTIEAGSSIAITGPSGGGKSTLTQVLLGLVEPSRGTILVDGVPLKEYGLRRYREQVSAVLQDDVLFSGTITQNISLFSNNPDPDLIEECSRAAAIHDDIIQMKHGYDTTVHEFGAGISGGQIQRILLARALYRKPRILVMDEATSALDASNERRVSAAIAKMGITRVIVAHRKETLESAQKILHLTNGRIGVPFDRAGSEPDKPFSPALP